MAYNYIELHRTSNHMIQCIRFIKERVDTPVFFGNVSTSKQLLIFSLIFLCLVCACLCVFHFLDYSSVNKSSSLRTSTLKNIMRNNTKSVIELSNNLYYSALKQKCQRFASFSSPPLIILSSSLFFLVLLFLLLLL